MKDRTNEEIKGAAALVDKIEQVDQNTKQIYKEILKNTKGLNSKEEHMKAYQYDEDFFIAPNMIGKEAVDDEVQRVEKIKISAKKIAEIDKDTLTLEAKRTAKNVSPLKS